MDYKKYNVKINENDSIKTIVIYGTADCAKNIITNCPSNKIAGLMDQNKTGEIIYNYKVLSYEEVAELDNPVIVIAARTSVINIIYRRIKDFCNEHKIEVYDINGNLLKEETTKFIENKCFNLEYKDLQNLIESSDVISFDIFDTLISRKVLRPRDVFNIIDKKTTDYKFIFSKERVKAEEELNENVVPNIYMIYEKLCQNTGITKIEAEKLIEIEIETEKSILVKRNSICNLLSDIKAKGKKVILVSDMYFTKDILVDILKNCGIVDYDKIYVSCEYGVDKAKGLFNEVIADMKINPTKLLHVGDNEIADYQAAKEVGINAYRIYGVCEMLELSGYSSILDNRLSIEENCIVAKFATEIYNNPFSGFDSKGKIVFNSDEEMVRTLIAPVVFKYSVWIINQINKYKSPFVIFPSRDGYLLEKLYQLQKNYWKLPDCKYIYVSRRATMVSMADSKEKIDDILYFPDDRNFRDMIKARFGIDPGDIKEVADINDDIYEAILKICKEEKNNYLEYIKKEIAKIENGTVFVDFVAMGRIQEAFQRLIGKKLLGLYFVKRISDGKGTQNLKVESLYPVEDDYSSSSKVYQYYYLLECIMTSFEPSLLKFNEKGEVVLYPENRTIKYIENLQKCHNAIFSYCEEMLNIGLNYEDYEADVTIYDSILGFFSQDYSSIKDSILLSGKNVDEFMGKEVNNFNR